MLRKHNNLLVQIHKFLDISITILAFVSAYFIKKYFLPKQWIGLVTAPDYYIVLLLVIIIWYLTFRIFNFYGSYRKQTSVQIFWKVFKAVTTGIVLMNFLMYLLKITDVSRIMMGIFFVINVLLLSLSKGIIFKTLEHFRKKGFFTRSFPGLNNSSELLHNFTFNRHHLVYNF